MDLKIKENTEEEIKEETTEENTEEEIKEETTEEKAEEINASQVIDKVLKLIGKKLDYLIKRHESQAEQDKQEAFGLIKTDELIKIAKFLKEMEDGAKMQVESEQSDEDEHIRFVLDKSVRRLAK